MDAIDRGDAPALCEELGDVLLQVVFHAELERETGGFAMDNVIDGICQKLVYRHPHVFGNQQAATSDEVLVNWELLKRKEKGQASTADAVEAVAHTLPALWRAEKIQKKTAAPGFQWNSAIGALDKLGEETQELRQAVARGGDVTAPHGVAEEVGDTLFLAAKVAQMNGVDPEEALHRACDKYSRRFRMVEQSAGDKPLSDCSEAELSALWNAAKAQENKS